MNPSEAADLRFRDLIERPIFIVSSPRSGSTLLFETLARAPGLFTVGGESHHIIEGVPALAMPLRGWTSNRLTGADAAPEIVSRLTRSFYEALIDRDGRPASGRVRMLEKTPKNALRIPFFDAIWPDARYIFLYRDPRPTLASMIEAWMSGKFRTYPRLPGWDAWPWSLLLIPGWQDLKGRALPEIVAHQWATTIRILIDDLARLRPDQVVAVSFEQLTASPQQTIECLASALDFEWDQMLGPELPRSRTTVSIPAPEKWRGIEHVIEQVRPIVEEIDEQARSFVAERSCRTTKANCPAGTSSAR